MYNNVLPYVNWSDHAYLILMLHQHYIGLFESECKKKQTTRVGKKSIPCSSNKLYDGK